MMSRPLHLPPGNGQVGCEAGARTRPDSRSDRRFGCLSSDVSAAPAHRRLRAKRRGQASRCWYIDETYVKVAGRGCYLYRAIDRDGQPIDLMLSEKRDKHAARRFLRRLVDVAEGRPLRVATDIIPRTEGRSAGSSGRGSSIGQHST